MSAGIRWLLYCACGLAGSVAAEAISAQDRAQAALNGYPCAPCTAEDIRELGIVAPPPEVRPACTGYDDDPTGILCVGAAPVELRELNERGRPQA